MNNHYTPSLPSKSAHTFLQGGGEMGALTRAHDWPQTTLGPPETWPLSLRTTVGIVLHSASPMFLFWGNELICFYNDAYRPVLSSDGKHPALGKPAKDVWPEVWNFIGPLIQQVITTGEPAFFEDQFVPVQRNDVYWTFGYSPAYGEDGQIAGVLVTCTQTTDKALNAQLPTQPDVKQQQILASFEQAPVGIAVIAEENLTFRTANSFYSQLVGRAPHELVGKPLLDALPELRGQGFDDLLRSVFATGNPFMAKEVAANIVRHNRSETIYVDFTYQPQYEGGNRVLAILVVCVDVTEQVLARRKIEESEQRFQAAVAAVQGILWTNNAQGEMEGEQPGWVALTGQSYAEYRGYGWTNTVHPDDAQPTVVAWQEAVSRRGTFEFEHRVRLKDGQYEPFAIRGIPLLNPDGTIREWVGVHTNITEQRKAETALKTSEAKLRSVVGTSPSPIALYAGREMRIELANQSVMDIWGKGNDVIGKRYVEVLPELINQAIFNQLDDVYTTGIPFRAKKQRIDLVVNGKVKPYYFDYSFTPVFDTAGQVYGVLNTGTDITELVLTQQKIEESERRFQSLIREVSVGIVVLIGEEMRVEIVNDAYAQLLDRSCEDLLGKPLFSIVPEAEVPFRALLDNVRNTGETLYLDETPYFVWVNGIKKEGFVNVIYQPYREHDGAITGVTALCQDVTGQVLDRQKIAQQKSYLQNALDIADLGTFRVDTGNNVGTYTENIRQWFGLASLEQPMDNIISKVHPDDQKMVAQVLEAANLDKGQDRHDITYRLADAHSNTIRYLRSIGKTQHTDGKPHTIDGIIQDVTLQVLARQKIEEAEATLRGAVELAELGTWELNAVTGIGTYSDRIKSWFGYKTNTEESHTGLNPVHERDRSRIAAAVQAALQRGSLGVYDEEYTVVDQQTGAERIIHALGKTYFDAQGKALKIIGTAQNITRQRNLQYELEQQVQARTQELQESVHDLKRSNENLQQFAYIASHDLQEPLRKIQAFSDLVQNQYGEQLGETGNDYLGRMQASANRMSTLIRDLLTYSRISTQQDSSSSVALDTVLNAVLGDLELIILETGAVVEVSLLPVVQGDKSQLGQLFQNLLSNALKFRQPGTSPQISITSQTVAAHDLPPAVKPTRIAMAYHCIAVTDNGIGFDEQYVERIFQVFQRLHGKSQYAGTGIGLAICEKVAANHGGAITAQSQPGSGATFSVYLPV